MSTTLQPHVPTLAFATVVACTILGSLLLCTWVQNRDNRALLYWGPAHLFSGIGTGLLALRGAIPDFVSIEIANALIIGATGLHWCGARVFERRPAWLGWVLAAVLTWIALCQVPFIGGDLKARGAVISLLAGTFTLLAVYLFWRGRSEKLLSRWPATALMSVQGTAYLIRAGVISFLPLPPEPVLFQSGWFGAMAMAGLFYTITVAFLQLAMTKERTELLHRHAALTDPLTELLNRRAFLREAQTRMEELRRLRWPVAVLVCDLDRFKQINDRHGHAAGDRVLETFAAAARSALGSSALIGRMGGEEFAALLPECTESDALAAGERLRATFIERAAGLGLTGMTATVSVGVAGSADGCELIALLARADSAVYRAKAAGRNCVRLPPPHERVDVAAAGRSALPKPIAA